MGDNDLAGITSSLAIGAVGFLAVLVLYDVVRILFPALAYHREAAAAQPETRSYDGTPLVALPRPRRWPLAWVYPALVYPEKDLVNTHGLDVTLYLRFLATQAKVFAVLTVFTAIVLYPTYITAPNRFLEQDNSMRPSGIEIVSLSNVPEKSNRLWVTLVSEIFVVTIICLFLYRDISKYTEYRRIYRSQSNNPSNYAIVVQDIPPEFRTREHLYATFDRIFPSQVVDVHLVRNARHLFTLKTKYMRAVRNRERARYRAQSKANRNDHSSEQAAGDSPSGSQELTSAERRKISHWQGRQESLEQQIQQQEQNLEECAPTTHAAFIVFRSKRVTTFAATAPVWTIGTTWNISRAPEPRAINWNKLPISNYTRRPRMYISFFMLLTLTILWAGPASFIQAMGNFEDIAAKFPQVSFLQDLLNVAPDIGRFLEGVLPPLILYLILLVVPFLVRFVVSFERIHSKVFYESKVRNYVFFFYVMSNFTYVVIIGSALKEFKAIWENPTKIVSLLSTSIPAQATFLMKYVLINSFLGSTVGMLNHGRLLVRPFLMLRAKTPWEKRKADAIFTQYPFAKMYAVCAMIGLISMVYSTIAPLMCAVALLYFCIAYLCTKQLLLYSHRPRYEGGGYMFRDSWTGMVVGLYIHQLSMTAIFSLKRATAQAILSFLSFGVSVWFTWFCRRNFIFRAKHGSLVDQAQEDNDTGSLEVADNFSALYKHPGLLPIKELMELEEMETAEVVKEIEKG